MRVPVLRFFVSSLTGLFVCGVLMVAAWYSLRSGYTVCRRQGLTRDVTLRMVAEQVAEYQGKHGMLPTRLTDIPDIHGFRDDRGGTPTDEWDNEIQYSVSDEGYTLYSFGRDGRNGGLGLDAELYHDRRNHEETLATLQQFYATGNRKEVDAGGFILVGLLTGAVVAVTVFWSLRDQDRKGQRMSRVRLIHSTLSIVLLACFFGAILLVLHIPTGH